jgi:hypothetical protein
LIELQKSQEDSHEEEFVLNYIKEIEENESYELIKLLLNIIEKNKINKNMMIYK